MPGTERIPVWTQAPLRGDRRPRTAFVREGESAGEDLPPLGSPPAAGHTPEGGRLRGRKPSTGHRTLRLEGRDVLLVEDVVDTGLTLGFLTRCFGERGPASLSAVTLLDRPYRRLVDDIPLDHVGFTVPDELFAGYGLGLDERWRALPDLHLVLADELPAAIDAA